MRKLALAAVLAALLVATPPASLEATAIQGTPPDVEAGTGKTGGRGDALVLNEIFPAPKTVFSGEWVELFNTGNSSVDLGGWALDDLVGAGSEPFVIPNGTLIPAGSFFVFYNSTTNIALNNDGDTVRLLDPTGNEVDSYRYDSSSYDASFGRFPDGGPSWRIFDAPTPGASNGAFAPAGPADGSVLVTQVYYHAYPGKGDEYVAVTNPDARSAADLSGWKIDSGSAAVVFPNGTSLAPGATIFVTGNASDFLPDAGFLPDLETRGSRADVKQARPTGNWPALGNDGGRVVLENSNGETIDVLAWGRAFNGTGWSGPAAEALSAGRVARRAGDGTGRWEDTNSSADWPADHSAVVGRSDFLAEAFDADSVTAFVSPDCSFQAIAGELDKARFSVLLAVYQFESWPLARKLVEARERNVAVSVLLEGAPVEGITDQERAVAKLLSESGASVNFLAALQGQADRYSYLHAKYCVIDNATCIVASENWKASSIPSDNTYGNRGFGAVVKSPGLAGYLSAVFASDSNPAMRDVIPYSPGGGMFGPPPPGFVPDATVPAGSYKPRFLAASFGPGIRVQPVLAPDTSRLENGSVLGLIRSAARTLHIEQLSCSPDWNFLGLNRSNAYLDSVVEAARRGVHVRLLLDGTYIDPTDFKEDNNDVLNALAYIAAAEGLDLQVRISRIPGALKLHNKAVVADGERVLVSSINWGRNSVFENREVGLVLDGAGVGAYFEEVFGYDWNASAPGPRPGGTGGDGENPGMQAGTVSVLAVLVLLAAVAVLVVFRRAGSRRRRY